MRKTTLSRNIFQSRIKTSELPIKCLILVKILQTKTILCSWMFSRPVMGNAKDFKKKKKKATVYSKHPFVITEITSVSHLSDVTWVIRHQKQAGFLGSVPETSGWGWWGQGSCWTDPQESRETRKETRGGYMELFLSLIHVTDLMGKAFYRFKPMQP